MKAAASILMPIAANFFLVVDHVDIYQNRETLHRTSYGRIRVPPGGYFLTCKALINGYMIRDNYILFSET